LKGGFGLDHLVATEREDPQPGPGRVRVRVRYASVNYRDLLMVTGKYNPRQPLPLIPLSDGAGEVDAVGPGVALSVGTRVTGLFSPKWQAGEPTLEKIRTSLGGPLDGALAEYLLLDEAAAVPIPSHLELREAATLPCAAATAWTSLVSEGGLKAGDTVLVQGSGGVSTFALDFARMHGARVIATTSSAQKAAFLRERGAAEIVDYVAEPAWGKRVRSLTGGRGVDHVVEVGGAGTLQESIRAVRSGGTISLIGVLAGGAADLNMTPVLMNMIRIQGVLVGSRENVDDMYRAIAQAGYRPHVDRVFAWGEARQAFEHLAAGKHRGKIVIAID
jgi:NADPH:quinone reductase-like Zn-dependent oxidoreductase